MGTDICAVLEKYSQQVVDWRREFHRYAERGWCEFRTTSRIVEILTAAGIPVRYGREILDPAYAWSYPAGAIEGEKARAVAQGADPTLLEKMNDYTGAVATIETGRPGKVCALRFDIDALGVNERQEPDHRPFREGFASVNEGAMHACAHDGHTAMGLALCLALNELKDRLNGTVKVIFQPGEEGAIGAQSVAEGGVLDDVDVFLSGHLGLGLPTGTFAVFSDGFLASTKFDLTFKGRSAHAGASPQEGCNAVLAASSAILAMYSLCQDGRGATRVNVGTIHGGTGRNVVADEVHLRVESRGTTNDVEQRLFQACLSVAEGAAKMYGCTVSHEIMGYAPAFSCDEELAAPIRAAAEQVEGIDTILPVLQATGSEDVGYMIQKVRDHGGKGAYMGIGTDIPSPHHSVTFDIDEKAILQGSELYFRILTELMK